MPAAVPDHRAAPTRVPPLSFAGWLVGILQRWRLFAATGLLVGGLFVLAAVVLPPSYRAEASFVSNSSEAIKLPGALAGMAGLAGMASQAGMNLGSDPSETPAFYAQLIQSRELLTRVLHSPVPDYRTDAPADSAPLLRVLELRRSETEAGRVERGVEHLKKVVTFTGDPRTNLVTVMVDMPAAELSSTVANRVVELVSEFNREQRVSRARARREFLEERLEVATRDLRTAEDQQRGFLMANRQLRSPALQAEEQRLQRNVSLAEDMFRTMRSEFESARLQEIDNAPLVTPVDRAVPPQRPRWPRPFPLAVLAVVAGGLVGLLVTGTVALLADWAARNADESSALRRAIGRRRRRPPEAERPPARAAYDAPPVASPGAAAGAGMARARTLDGD